MGYKARRIDSSRVVELHTGDGQVIEVEELARAGESFGRTRFMILFQDAIDQAVDQFRSGSTLRVLLALTKELDWKAWRRLDQLELADRLELHRSQVTQALLGLIDAGYVERRGKRSQYEWRLCQHFGWRGNVKSYHAQAAAAVAEREPSLPLGPVKIAESILWKLII